MGEVLPNLLWEGYFGRFGVKCFLGVWVVEAGGVVEKKVTQEGGAEVEQGGCGFPRFVRNAQGLCFGSLRGRACVTNVSTYVFFIPARPP